MTEKEYLEQKKKIDEFYKAVEEGKLKDRLIIYSRVKSTMRRKR